MSQFLMVNLSLSKWGGSIVPLFNSALYQVYGQLYALAALPPEKMHVVWSPELVWKSGKDARFLLLCSVSLACLWLTMWYREGWNILLLVASWKKTVISSNKHCIWHFRTETYTTQLVILSRFTSRKGVCAQSGRLKFSCPVRSSHS
jgi:hypothetical protein